jgi:hypothetical protein
VGTAVVFVVAGVVVVPDESSIEWAMAARSVSAIVDLMRVVFVVVKYLLQEINFGPFIMTFSPAVYTRYNL